jgi:hypothetical protein
LNDKSIDKKRTPAPNRRLAKKRVQCINEALSFLSSLVLADSLVLRNPLLRQAPKRYMKLSVVIGDFRDYFSEKRFTTRKKFFYQETI